MFIVHVMNSTIDFMEVLDNRSFYTTKYIIISMHHILTLS